MIIPARDIFYSGSHDFNGNLDSVNEIDFLVSENYLVINKIIISSKNEYYKIFDNPNAIGSYCEADGGGKAHVAIKIIGKKFLKQNRKMNSLYEHPFCGYYPDILSVDSKIVIECGHTQNPEKMLEYFLNGNINEFIQIPYPTEEDESICGYSFTSQNNLNNFLLFLEKEKRSSVKKLFKNIRNSN